MRLHPTRTELLLTNRRKHLVRRCLLMRETGVEGKWEIGSTLRCLPPKLKTHGCSTGFCLALFILTLLT